MFFTFKNSNNYFIFWKSVKGWPSFKNKKITTNWMILHLLSIVILPTHTISTTMFQPLLAHNHLFLACWLSINMKYCFTTHLMHATLHFCLPTCFWKLSNFNINNFSLPLISLHTLHWTIINLPSHLITTFAHTNFATQTS